MTPRCRCYAVRTCARYGCYDHFANLANVWAVMFWLGARPQNRNPHGPRMVFANESLATILMFSGFLRFGTMPIPEVSSVMSQIM